MHHTAIQDGAHLPVKCDPISSSQSALAIEGVTEALVRAGQVFRTVDAAVVAGAGVKEWLLTAPNTAIRCWLRCWIKATGGGVSGQADLYEGPTLGVGGAGTALAELNLDRNSATAATLVATEDPDIAADGTLLAREVLSAAGSAALQTEAFLILDQNVRYLVRWTDGGAGSNATLLAEWAEV